MQTDAAVAGSDSALGGSSQATRRPTCRANPVYSAGLRRVWSFT